MRSKSATDGWWFHRSGGGGVESWNLRTSIYRKKWQVRDLACTYSLLNWIEKCVLCDTAIWDSVTLTALFLPRRNFSNFSNFSMRGTRDGMGLEKKCTRDDLLCTKRRTSGHCFTVVMMCVNSHVLRAYCTMCVHTVKMCDCVVCVCVTYVSRSLNARLDSFFLVRKTRSAKGVVRGQRCGVARYVSHFTSNGNSARDAFAIVQVRALIGVRGAVVFHGQRLWDVNRTDYRSRASPPLKVVYLLKHCNINRGAERRHDRGHSRKSDEMPLNGCLIKWAGWTPPIAAFFTDILTRKGGSFLPQINQSINESIRLINRDECGQKNSSKYFFSKYFRIFFVVDECQGTSKRNWWIKSFLLCPEGKWRRIVHPTFVWDHQGGGSLFLAPQGSLENGKWGAVACLPYLFGADVFIAAIYSPMRRAWVRWRFSLG